MLIFKSAVELRAFLERAENAEKQVGFVPTMGALHQGHLNLISRSVEENEITVCSIFVNPTQFNNSDDLEKYPRIPEQDFELLRNAGCDAVYFPDVSDIYPKGPITREYPLGEVVESMDGKFRPGHFQGVATVVHILLDKVRPHRAYFGKKDYQQLLVIRRLVEVERLPVEIVGCPITREDDGLAMSSRNLRLTSEQRKNATAISRALFWIRENAMNYSVPTLIEKGHEMIEKDTGMELEYLEIRNADNLHELTEINPSTPSRAFAAAFCGDIRLIDNVSLFR
jgi:pantoate--beta-alanine ligase